MVDRNTRERRAPGPTAQETDLNALLQAVVESVNREEEALELALDRLTRSYGFPGAIEAVRRAHGDAEAERIARRLEDAALKSFGRMRDA